MMAHRTELCNIVNRWTYKESQELVKFCWFNQYQRTHIFYSTLAREQRTGFFSLLSFILKFNNFNT